jgi:hypothetical protein
MSVATFSWIFDRLIYQCRRSRVQDREQPEIGHPLLEDLKKDGDLKTFFEKKAGVAEGYTVEEHTSMVLAMAEKYKTSYQGAIERLVSWDDFLLFLALHDIGKGVAREKQDPAFTNPIAFKEAELDCTIQIMTPVLQKRGVAQKSIRLFTELLRYDAIGVYLQGKACLKEVRDQLLEVACRSGLDPLDALSIFDAFHAYDSASYPSLFSRLYYKDHQGTLQRNADLKEKLSQLQEALDFPRQGERIFERVQQQIADRSLRSISENDCNRIEAYVHSMNIRLLASNEEELVQRKEMFRSVKRGIRDLLRYFTEKKEWPALHSNRSLHFSPSFEDEAIEFRHSYLSTYSADKLKRNGIDENQELLPFFRLKWLHGANSGVLPSLLEAPCLVPAGRLVQKGIVPLSGEVDVGFLGVNRDRLSGTSLLEVGRAVDYGRAFNASAENELKKLSDEDIRWMASDRFTCDNVDLGSFGAANFSRFSFAIRRLRVLDPKSLEPLVPQIKKAIENARKAFEAFKKTEIYKIRMPRRLNSGCSKRFRHPNDLYFWDYEKYREGLQHMESALSEPLRTPKDMNAFLKDPFPMVFGSKTRHAYMSGLHHRGSSRERLVYGAMALGKDVQEVFVPAERIQRVQELFADKGIGVNVRDLDTLRQLGALYKKAVPYMDRISGK